MKFIKIQDLRAKSIDDLTADVVKLRADMVTSTRAMAIGEMRNVSKIKHLRIEIARCLTIVREKSIQSSDSETLRQAQGREEK